MEKINLNFESIEDVKFEELDIEAMKRTQGGRFGYCVTCYANRPNSPSDND